MKVKFLRSATAIIETADARILMDPWLVDGTYFGSWSHWPPYQWNEDDFRGLTHIYVSHVHPDHFDLATMRRLNKDIPVLIHRYSTPFLRKNIEAMGFAVIELPHNKEFIIGKTSIKILAADNCDPEVCGRFFSCAALVSPRGSTQIDSLIVISDGKYTIVNTNDCPFGLAQHAITKLPQPDLLMTSYGAAGPFPQCFTALSHEQKLAAADKKASQMLQQALSYVEALRPKVTFPFAGQYILSGRLWRLNQYLGLPEIDDIYDLMEKKTNIIRIERGGCYDLATGETDMEWRPTDRPAKQQHIEHVLSKMPFSFDGDEAYYIDQVLKGAMERLEHKRKEQDIHSHTTVIVNGHELNMGLSPNGDYIKMDVDPKLFWRLLKGPKYAHWNNAEIGSHISYERSPDIFHRGINNLMSFFHS